VEGGKRRCTPVPPNEGVEASCDLKGLAETCAKTTTVPYRNVYACYSLAPQQGSQGIDLDDEGVAYLNDRLCAAPDPSKPCFFHRPRRCHFLDPKKNEVLGAHCDWVGDGVYRNCKSPDGEHTYCLSRRTSTIRAT
jgi:hypothetical protein